MSKYTVEGLHEVHGSDVALHRPAIAQEEVHELALWLQEQGWAGVQCLREAVEAREAGRREGLTVERLAEALSAADAALQTMGCPWGCDGPDEPPCDVHVFLAAHAEQASEPGEGG